MPAYLYKTAIYKKTERVANLDSRNSENLTEFENVKSSAKRVSNLIIGENTFEIIRPFNAFKNLIDGVVRTWADIRYIETDEKYTLMLLTNSII